MTAPIDRSRRTGRALARPTEPIGYVEVPDFHVALARREQPELEDRPIVVGGDPRKRGKVVAASASLRERGIVDGMGVAEALDRASDAIWRRTDMRLAREVSGRLRAIVRGGVDAVEVDGLAGFYLRAPSDPDDARALGRALAEQVRDALSLPLRAGFAPVRFAARLAAAEASQDVPVVISGDALASWLDRQPLERLPGVGPKTAARLAELGARDVPGLRAIGLERLEVLLGNHGRSLWLLACGEDPQPLRARRHPASLSREATLEADAPDREGLARVLAGLAEALESALQRDGLRASRIALKLTGPRERTLTRSLTLDAPASRARELAAAALTLLERVDLSGHAFRRAGLVLRGLEASGGEDRQLDLF